MAGLSVNFPGPDTQASADYIETMNNGGETVAPPLPPSPPSPLPPAPLFSAAESDNAIDGTSRVIHGGRTTRLSHSSSDMLP